MSVLVRKANSFETEIVFSAAILIGLPRLNVWKMKLDRQEVLDLLQNLPSESNDAQTNDSSDEAVPENNLQEFS
ncbi:uncharacterized protein TNCV_2756751 [Trichonephila clavipes]|nr:uncharacterized protein TNCV_2756751 [Trichonephila clavipes]